MQRMISVVSIAVMSVALVSGAMAEENEGLLQRMYKKYVKKEDVARKDAAKPVDQKMSAGAKKPAVNTAATQAKAEKAVAEGARVVPAAAPKKELTKDEMIVEIKDELGSDDEILSFIPDIKKEKGPDGKEGYVFTAGGQAKKLEELDKDLIGKIYTRVRQTATKLRTDRINKQLENIRNLQQMQQMQQTLRTQTQTVPQIPRVPSQPASVTQVPRAPTPPPSTPRR